MTTQTSTDPEVAAYARQVREALADVPAARLEELLEDLEEHLVEVASETPGPLTDRLGSPADYAAELRRAAGLPDAGSPVGPVAREGATARWVRRVQASGPYGHVVAFLPELRPAWWVVRGWAAVAAVDALFVGPVDLPLPTLGLGVVGWVVTAAAVTWSVRLGLRARAAGTASSRPVAVTNVVLAGCALVALVGLAGQQATTEYYPTEVSYDSGPTTLTHEDGTPITNIVPYGPDGEPLTGVLLYDQDGRPVDNLSTATTDGGEVRPQQEGPAQPDNAYPQSQVVTSYDEFGNLVEEEFPAPAAAPTTAAATPTP